MRVGGGDNHRFGLDDAVLVKDNHRAFAGGVGAAVGRVRAGVGHMVKVEVEVDTLDQLDEALAPASTPSSSTTWPWTRSARRSRARGRAFTEASGGVTPRNRAGGRRDRRRPRLPRLAHPQRPNLDVSLEVEPG